MDSRTVRGPLRPDIWFGFFSSDEKATIILGFIEFYIPEADITTEIQTERAMEMSGYHSRHGCPYRRYAMVIRFSGTVRATIIQGMKQNYFRE